MKVLRILRDNDPINPRSNDCLGNMACWHNRYFLGDGKPATDPKTWLDQQDDIAVCLPLYLYDHGGIELSTKPFACQFDSGFVGWMVATNEKIKESFGELTKENIEKAKISLEAEVKVYNHFLNGNCWGFELIEETYCDCCGAEQEKEIDSCWGFFGDTLEEIGIKDYVQEDYQDLLDKAWNERD